MHDEWVPETGGVTGQIINLGGDLRELWMMDPARRMMALAGTAPRVEVCVARSGSVMRRCPEVSVALSLPGSQPDVWPVQGLPTPVDWYPPKFAPGAGR